MECFRVYDWMFEKCNFNNAEVNLYAFIYSYHEKGIECRFSFTELASLLDKSRITIIRTIKKLKRKNLIIVENTREKDGGCGMNVYSIKEGGEH